MEFINEELEARLTVPDKPTYRQILAYDSARDLASGLPFYEKLWRAANEVIEEWESPHLDRGADLEGDAPSKKAIFTLEWAGLAVHSWRFDFDEVPKNS